MGVDLHLTAEIFEAAHEPADGLAPIEAIEVVGAEVLVVDVVAEHEEAGIKHGGGDGEDGFLGASSGLDAQELGAEIGVLRADGRPGDGDERGLEPGGSFADADRTAFTGALVAPRTE